MDKAFLKEEAVRLPHPEDQDHSSDFSEPDEDDFDIEETLDYEIPGTGPNDMPFFRSSTKLTGSCQTGVKGVIADAHSFENARRRIKKSKPVSAEYEFAGYISPPDMDARAPLNVSDPESGEEDESFIREWRKNRLQELRTGVSNVRRQSPSKRKYGRVETVDAAGYLDAVERVSPETIVVVTIFNDKSEESRFVEDCLFTLSRRYVTTRFIKLHHVEAEMESAVVPAVLAYKGGELFANIIRIVDEIPPGRNLSTDSLELVLRRANVLHKD